MGANEIKIIIGGDATQLTTAANEAKEAIGSFTGLSNQTSGLKKLAKESTEAAAAIKEIPAAAENIFPEGSVLEARETVKRLRGELESLSGVQINSDAGRFLASEFELATQELKKLEIEAGLAKEKVAKIVPPKLPLGAIEEARAKIKALQAQILSLNTDQIKSGVGKAIAADIKIAEKELVALEAQAGLTSVNSGNLLKQAFGGLRQIANILPGIGIAGIIAFATEPIINYVTALFGASKQTKEAEENIKKLKSANENAFSSTAQESTQVGLLVAALKSETETRERKLAAIKQLQSIAPENFKNLKLEGDAVVGLDSAYRSYLDNLKNVIAVKIQQAQLEQLIEKLLKKQGTNLLGAQSLGTIESAKKSLQQLQDLQKAGQFVDPNQVKILEGIINKDSRDIDDLNKQINQLFDNIQVLSKGIKIPENDGNKKAEDELKKRLEALQKIQEATKDATTRVGIQESIFELQTKITIRDQKKNGLSTAEVDQAIQGFKKQLQTEFDKQAIELELTPKARFSQVVRTEISNKNVESEIAKATGLDKKITIPTQFDIDLKFNGKEFAENADRIRKQVEGIKDALFSGIVNGIQEGASILGEAFANILQGGDITSSLARAAQGLLGVIGSILQDVGKQIIVTSSLVAALKKAIKGLFGPNGEAIGLAVGAALIATGALLKNIKFDVPKLASGGIATSATLGIFGERGPEAILPLSKLPDLFKSMSNSLSTDRVQPIVISGNLRVDGTDLQLMLERVQSRRSRLG